jgi:hypothetical protein
MAAFAKSWRRDDGRRSPTRQIESLLLAISFNELDGILFDREIDGYHGGYLAHYEVGFVGQPDFFSARGCKGSGTDNLSRLTLAFRAYANNRGDCHLELIILRHGSPRFSNRERIRVKRVRLVLSRHE